MNYVVQPGDTLNSIAARFGVPVQELIRVNRIQPPFFIYVGQNLIIPVPGPGPGPRPPGPRPPGVEQRLDRLERRVDRLDNRVDRLERRVTRLEERR